MQSAAACAWPTVIPTYRARRGEILREFYSVTARAGIDLLILYEDGYGCPPGVQHLVRKMIAIWSTCR